MTGCVVRHERWIWSSALGTSFTISFANHGHSADFPFKIRFPLARPIICGKWVAALRRNNFKPTKYSNICSQHFTKDCFKSECNNRVLKDNAVPSLFTFNLNIKSEPLDHHFPSEIHFPDLCLPLTPSDLAEDDLEEEEACSNLIDIQNDTAVVSCDHNYTADETNRNWEAEREWTQQKRINHLEGQVRSLRKKLKTMQQKCRRQDRKLKRMKAAITATEIFHGPAFSK
ncbi:THAP domain-containing protein 1-like isoform X1 [Takifugu flavidus]|uniref:THAP domain-containing protein 1-like isoform X1 n=1 Tax=Takifugu flavidus TaxID=433684 RepID=UPI00254414EE|nr:THAP domain-containing protein 1-like isoform X1 [Takifugu flavidus]